MPLLKLKIWKCFKQRDGLVDEMLWEIWVNISLKVRIPSSKVYGNFSFAVLFILADPLGSVSASDTDKITPRLQSMSLQHWRTNLQCFLLSSLCVSVFVLFDWSFFAINIDVYFFLYISFSFLRSHMRQVCFEIFFFFVLFFRTTCISFYFILNLFHWKKKLNKLSLYLKAKLVQSTFVWLLMKTLFFEHSSVIPVHFCFQIMIMQNWYLWLWVSMRCSFFIEPIAFCISSVSFENVSPKNWKILLKIQHQACKSNDLLLIENGCRSCFLSF